MKPSETPQAGARPAGRPGARHAAAARPAWALAALLGAMFLGNVDVAIANIAGPSIRASLHASGGELELIVSGYTLAYAEEPGTVFALIREFTGQDHGPAV